MSQSTFHGQRPGHKSAQRQCQFARRAARPFVEDSCIHKIPARIAHGACGDETAFRFQALRT